ncbi:class I SAM-dependent RNA methyltransferase [Parvibaculaceae bacterium PLY_AMNH_Bact1]|nr:class I SAM-dependent RNA methyltransferase [Parvibaculaceae bacterium PLY_AMNH_Bact1]
MSEASLTIDHVGAQGDGVVRADEGPIYIPRTLPGETVRADIVEGRGSLLEVLTPSQDRTDPHCSHFGTCGGCALQHQSEPSYLAWKRDQLLRALESKGIDAPVAETIACEPGTRRRATFAAMRTRKTVRFGFFERASHTIVDVASCPILLPEIEAAIPALRELVGPGLTRKGKASVSVTATSSGLDVSVTGGKADPDLALRQALADGAAKADIARLTWDGDILAERRPPVLDLAGIEVALPPGAFLQATKAGEETMVNMVTEALRESGSVIDLFAGCGTFSLALAASHKVKAVEGAKAQCAALELAVRRLGPRVGLKPLTVERRDLARRPLRPDELNNYEAAVIDPPRAGAATQCEALASSSIPVIASVSCNPATFARDARTLIDGGYRLESVAPLDQFLWSPHIELVGIFRRE